MRSLRVRFENEAAVAVRIHEDTQGHPLLVQFYCLELIKQLEKEKERVLTLGHVDGIDGVIPSSNLWSTPSAKML